MGVRSVTPGEWDTCQFMCTGAVTAWAICLLRRFCGDWRSGSAVASSGEEAGKSGPEGQV